MFVRIADILQLGKFDPYQDACEASPVLSGCVPEQPCRLPDLGDVPCMPGTQDNVARL